MNLINFFIFIAYYIYTYTYVSRSILKMVKNDVIKNEFFYKRWTFDTLQHAAKDSAYTFPPRVVLAVG